MPRGSSRIARRDAELGKVVGILKYAVKECERARSDLGRRLQDASPSAAAAKVVRSRARRCNRERSMGNSILDVHKTTNSGFQLSTSLYFIVLLCINFSVPPNECTSFVECRTNGVGRKSVANLIVIGDRYKSLGRSPEVAPVKCVMCG